MTTSKSIVRNEEMLGRRTAGESLKSLAEAYSLSIEGVRLALLRHRRWLLNTDCLSVRALSVLDRLKSYGYPTYTEAPSHVVACLRNVGLRTYNELEAHFKGAPPLSLNEFYRVVSKVVKAVKNEESANTRIGEVTKG